MDSISSKMNQTNITGSFKTKVGKDAELSGPMDSISLSSGLGGADLTPVLDVRVPTVTKLFPAEEKDKVLKLIQPGDIILESNDAYPGWQFLEKLVFGSAYTHAAIFEGDGKFIEATTGDPSGKGVVRNDLGEYLQGRISLEIIRPPYKTPEDREAALNYARANLGKDYDSSFNQNDDEKLYCAELVQRALESMPNPIKVPITNFFGKKAVGPNAFQKIEGGEVVYSTGSGFFKSRLSHYPLYLSGAVAAAVGGAALGPLGAVGGFIAGAVGSILVGNKIQEGEFSLFPGYK